MTKQYIIAEELNKRPLRYLNMKVIDVQEEVGKKLKKEFDYRGWSNNDVVVYSTLLCMLREVNKYRLEHE